MKCSNLRLQYCNEHEITVQNVNGHSQYIHIHSRNTTLGDTNIYRPNATPLLASLDIHICKS